MIHVILGTKAQIIKMSPVLHVLAARRLAFRVIDTGQHGATGPEFYRSLKLDAPLLYLSGRKKDLVSAGGGVNYLRELAPWLRMERERLFGELFGEEKGLALIHGDTLSTATGLFLARRAGLPVGLVEAGLTSGSLRRPFPEEFIRRLAERYAALLFTPSPEAAAYLKKRKVGGEIIDCQGNTGGEALFKVWDRNAPRPFPSPYAIAAFHRLENLMSSRRQKRITEMIKFAATRTKVIFVLHPPTQKALQKNGLLSVLEHAGVILRPLTPYSEFVALLAGAEFVMSDGGSMQEECALLGTPGLILRDATERPEGLGRNALLSNFDFTRLRYFLDNLPRFRFAPTPPGRPSAIIAERLAEFG